MTAEDVSNKPGTSSRRCALVILHESEEALERATALCDHIMQKCWEHLDIHLTSWPMVGLADEETGAEAAGSAATADILVVAACAEGVFPLEFTVWTEQWLSRRARREGALVGLLHPATGRPGTMHQRDSQLHRLALSAGMDYLNHLPEKPGLGIPDDTEWCTSRAETQTGTLEEIIRTDPPLSRE